MDIFLWIVMITLFFCGFLGLVFPFLPDIPFLLAGFILYALGINSPSLPVSFWIGAGFITLLSILVDLLAGGIAVKKYGGSPFSVWASIVGALLFSLFLGPLGLIVGAFCLVVLVELFHKKSWQDALSIGFGTLVGFFGGIFVKFLLMVTLLVWFFLKL